MNNTPSIIIRDLVANYTTKALARLVESRDTAQLNRRKEEEQKARCASALEELVKSLREVYQDLNVSFSPITFSMRDAVCTVSVLSGQSIVLIAWETLLGSPVTFSSQGYPGNSLSCPATFRQFDVVAVHAAYAGQKLAEASLN